MKVNSEMNTMLCSCVRDHEVATHTYKPLIVTPCGVLTVYPTTRTQMGRTVRHRTAPHTKRSRYCEIYIFFRSKLPDFLCTAIQSTFKEIVCKPIFSPIYGGNKQLRLIQQTSFFIRAFNLLSILSSSNSFLS